MSDATLHRLVERQTDRSPDAEAFRCGGAATTYRELDERANRLAHLLTAAGVRPGDRVGVCLERGPRLIAALLGVLKAGACYVPLDPDYPAARITYMARDSRMRAVLTRQELAGPFTDTGAALLCPDDAELEAGPSHPLNLDVPPDSLAYIIYTSGSTGRPKGAAIEHRSAAALLHWVRQTFTERELSGVLAATSVCFDLSVFEIFGTLAAGGRFLLVRNVLELAALGRQDGVRLLNTVPTAVSELLAAGAIPDSVETVAMAGEPLPAPLVARLKRLPHVKRVLNLYGPSEDTTYSTWAHLTAVEDPPSIGRPLPGTHAYVLDEDMRPVPDDTPGELYLGGTGLARGYFGRPRETAARFLPDPYADGSGTRMYRTGDRVVRREDGRLFFVGRIDDMVKIRGYRIEPGEIAAVLSAAPQVRQGAVKAVPGPGGTPRLVAYAVGETGDTEATRTAALLAHARERLPAYMVPSHVVWLERLPLTPNGKVDRKSLPEPDWEHRPPTAGRAAPRSGPEEAVAAIYREVLGVDTGRDDDFFALGGDSLQATRVATRLRAQLDAPLPLTVVFQHPTVAALTERVHAARRRARTGSARPGRGSALLSSAQQRMWFLDQLRPGDTSYLVSVIVKVGGAADAEQLCGAVQDVVTAHAALRTAFTTDHHDDPVQRVLPTATLPVRRVELDPGLDPERQLARLADEETATPIELDTAPLARCALATAEGRPVALVLTAHHIVFDGWSIGLFVRDLGLHYEARVAGTSAPEPVAEGPADISEEQRRWLAGPEGRAALEELAASLDGAPALLPMPTDLPRPAERTSRGAHLLLRLPESTAAAVRRLAARQRATLYMVGLAGFSALLAEWSGTSDLVLATAFAGRTSVAAERAIGCFVNTVPLRVEAPPGLRFTELLNRARQASLFAAARQDVPFEALVERLRPPRSMSHNPVVQVAFGVQNAIPIGYRGPGIELMAVRREPDEARLDLTLWLEERPDGLHALWTYSTELFHPSTIDGLHRRFVELLETASTDPTLTLGRPTARTATSGQA
ncbi:amino acid adenylation domain-containing protein [Streptomyces demainii]|uniref:Amino acid adenylation domain-containing protein n=1 Tax=Streptomyces demainii TaxID=588122 RepID=A0ABT9L6Z9_9ACTN|nr:amino acid adenylation domain-containing protein [Streptomyces demainii]MDP9616467.1 amino acid adenylation domain-containing protein [Streptomyces demainii]